MAVFVKYSLPHLRSHPQIKLQILPVTGGSWGPSSPYQPLEVTVTLIFSMKICSLDLDCGLTYMCKHTVCIYAVRSLVLSILLVSLIRLRASTLLLLTPVPCSAVGPALNWPCG